MCVCVCVCIKLHLNSHARAAAGPAGLHRCLVDDLASDLQVLGLSSVQLFEGHLDGVVSALSLLDTFAAGGPAALLLLFETLQACGSWAG